jgi:hypothetical protein
MSHERYSHDDPPRLSPTEVIALKDRLDIDHNPGLAPRVIDHIVRSMLLQARQAPTRAERRISSHGMERARTARRHRSVLPSLGFLAASWGMNLQKAIALPGSDWPETLTPPEVFAAALTAVDAEARAAADSRSGGRPAPSAPSP